MFLELTGLSPVKVYMFVLFIIYPRRQRLLNSIHSVEWVVGILRGVKSIKKSIKKLSLLHGSI